MPMRTKTLEVMDETYADRLERTEGGAHMEGDWGGKAVKSPYKKGFRV